MPQRHPAAENSGAESSIISSPGLHVDAQPEEGSDLRTGHKNPEKDQESNSLMMVQIGPYGPYS